ADEPASLSKNDRQGETFLIVSSLDAGQDRENIAKTSAMPHESSSRVPSLIADEGTKIKDQDLEIFGLKARVKSLDDKERRHAKDKERRCAEPSQEDASIIRGIIDIGEELGAKKSTELGSNDTEEMVNVLSSMEAANILSSGGATASISPANVLPATGVPTDSGSFPTVSAIFTIANVRLSEQLARDSEIARLHAEEELKIMIKGLDRSNEVFAKHISEYEQAEADLFVGEKIELIRELVKYQDHRAKILKGMTLDQIKEKIIPVWKQFEDFVPMSSKEENFEDQLWTHHQAFMHDPLDWKLYDICGVHHVSTKYQEIFMLVEKDYPLRKKLATVMIIQDEELIEASSLGDHLIQET
nr:hypothetical protein [Tanacetum cinerariifolium]